MPAYLKMPGFKRQLLLIVTILLIVPVLVMLYDVYFASKTDDILIVNLEKKLIGIVGQLGSKIEERLAGVPAEKKVEMLAGIFDQAAGPVAQANSGVRLGLYIPENNQILIQGFLHEFGKRLPEEKYEREQRIYQEALKGIAAVMKSGEPITRLGRTWDDQFLEHLVPVRSGSRVVAVLWAEERMHPLFARSTKIRLFIRYATLTVFSFGVLASLLTITSLVGQVRTIKNGLLELENNFACRLPEMAGEMGQITGAINTLAAALAEREQTIEQLRRSENLIALGRLVTQIAHELRNPVSIIQAVSEVLASRLKNSPDLRGYEEYIKKIEEQVERHNRLVGELLDFGRPDPGLIAPLNLNELISALLEECALLFQQRRIALGFAPSPEPLLIQGNQEKLKQVLLNILLNAVQAMPKGGTLSVRTEAVNHMVRVLIRDTGVGIPKDGLAQIFTPFYTRKAGGSGLGLAISHRIVQIHGGSISVESEPGTGTTFILSFPRLQPDEENKTLSSNS